MTTIENIVIKDGKKYLDVKVWTACCKTRFIVEDQGGNKLWNPITCQYLLWGMVDTVRNAEKYYLENL